MFYLGKIVWVITLKGKFQTLILWKCLFPVFVVPLLSMFYSGKERSWVLILLKMKLNQQTFCQLFCGKSVSSLFALSLSASFHKVRHQKNTVGREGIKREVSSEEIISFSRLNLVSKKLPRKWLSTCIISPSIPQLAAACRVSAVIS